MAVTHPGIHPETRPAGRAGERPRRKRRSVTARIAAAVAGLAFAAGAVYVQTLAMPVEQSDSFLTHRGTIGQAVVTDRFTVKVASVGAARAVDTVDFRGKVAKVATSNLFLLVNVVATTPREPMQLIPSGPFLLTEDGRRYQPTDKVDKTLTVFNKWIQPGLWSSGVLVFEVPTEAVEGARLVVVPPVAAVVVDDFAPEAEIDLGLSKTATERLLSRTEDYHPLAGKTS
ncbi:DUF4352 domain-containing protein [Microbispora sp. RL4-1S]|uniref:DUF4352 domain-containing protein n=1 Tax=Microbispora oryzae TaxID=2806554 RepID=A0A941AQP3_9ACTN|nr:DUF4352 domain-containing protein [Microbispora oryzae]MBP2704999.1 DUF4352 domain-containing protein [Microbispora oryzae]